MIETVVTKKLWAQSTSEEFVSSWLTLYLPRQIPQPTVTAHIDLARVEGSGTARASIWQYAQLFASNDDPKFRILEDISLNTDNPRWLISGVSAVTIPYAYSITFRVSVRNMFAYANCVIFTHQTSLLREFLTLPDKILSSVQDR